MKQCTRWAGRVPKCQGLSISGKVHRSSDRRRARVRLESFLTWWAKMRCLAAKHGKKRRAPCKKRLSYCCLERQRRKRKISIFCWVGICWDRPLLQALESRSWIFRFWVCLEPVPPVGNRLRWHP